MRGWIIVNGFLYTSKFSELTTMFLEAAEKYQIHLDVVFNSEVYTGVFEMRKGLKKPDFVLFWDKDVILARYLELSGIPVYNSSKAIEICDDKRKTYTALFEARLPIPQTVSAPMTYENIGFPSLEFIRRFEAGLGYPMIIKEAFGSFGEQVYKVDNRKQMKKIVSDLQHTPFLFQKYISTSCGQDVRLQVVGDKVIAAMRRFSDQDFRANITYGGSKEKYEPDEKACELAIRACRAVGCDFGGVDLLFGENGFVVCEVNSNAHFKNLYDCTGVNTAEYIMEYISSQERG
ncbi:MAG: RimK family alpha-L-glutamate ligase [Roseburia sp.]|nr:RimK family alpha-L-glutamate ligase [Roseburia sp.]